MIAIPLKIDHNHILDSVVEIRLVPKNTNSFIPDIVSVVRESIPGYTLSTAEIPKAVRDANPAIQFIPELTLLGKDFSVGIGFTNIVFNCKNGYKTWKEFFPFIRSVLERTDPYIESVVRVGVRFTNFFEGENDLKKFNIVFSAGVNEGRKFETDNASQALLKFSTTGPDASFNVTIANKAHVNNKSDGVLVDVDAFMDRDVPTKIGPALFECIEHVHALEKQMFFSMLESSFLKSLNPIY